MRQPEVTAVVFEGGQARTSLDELLARVREEVTLDTLEKLTRTPDVDRVILVTDRPEFASRAERLGVVADLGPTEGFHFGRCLRDVIVRFSIENVICMGGVAAPLLTPEEFGQVATTLKRERNLVIMNNVQSADLVAFAPARAIDEIELPDKDNPLGNLLRDIGLRRVLIPNSGRVNFDIDTPTDVLVMGLHPGCGPRARKIIDSLGWDQSKLRAFLEVLRSDSAELAVIGRVGPAVIQYINSHMVHRMRVFSEERGMKALGREGRGEVVSLLGFMLHDLGPAKFFDYLSKVCSAALIDTRVIFAHLRKKVSDWDRFQSDLGAVELIEDPWVKEFTACAGNASIPVVLGGHSLVSGGLWILAEMVVKEREESGYRYNTFILPRVCQPG